MSVFLLRYPWALFDSDPTAGSRELLDTSAPLLLPPDGCFMLAAPSALRVRVRRGKGDAVCEGPPFVWSGSSMRLYSLPGPARRQEVGLTVSLGDERSVTLVRLEHDPTSLPRLEEYEDGEETLSSESTVEQLVDTMTGLIQVLIEASEQTRGLGGGLAWESVFRLWFETRASRDRPRMARIVRHAEKFQRTLIGLAEAPRKVLRRVYLMQAAGRVREFDRVCLDWYQRRQGTTPAEKAGARQELLGVVREETHDTLENRVLRRTLELSAAAARRYARANLRFKDDQRVRRVRGYGRACRHVLTDQRLQTIRPLHQVPVPNYPLQFDPQYRTVWQAYLALLRERDEQDDVWRWQRRLWIDIGRIALVASLVHDDAELDGTTTPYGLSPLRLRKEQARGRFSDTSALLSVLMIEADGRHLVAELVDVENLAHTSQPEWLNELPVTALGPAVIVRLSAPGGGSVAFLLVWTIHTPSSLETPLEEVAASAARALQSFALWHQLTTDRRPPVRGLVLQATRAISEHADFCTGELVDGVKFPPTSAGLRHGAYLLRGLVTRAVVDMMPCPST